MRSTDHSQASPWLCLLALAVLASACSKPIMPDPKPALAAYVDALRHDDAQAIYGMLSTSSQQSLGRDGVSQALRDSHDELLEQANHALSPRAHLDAEATLFYPDGESAVLTLEDGMFHVRSADVLPTGARTPPQALEQLREGLARRSYQALLRVLSRDTRVAVDRDISTLVQSLEHPEGLDVEITGDRASVRLDGGHSVRLRREDGVWHVEDFQ